ncbi:MAG: YtxH domain-containing protein [Candidatus Saccharibacteria bacterium]
MSDYKRKIALSALVAGLIGYGVGILTAPKSGKETRNDVRKSAESYTHKLEIKLKKYHLDITELIAEAKVIGLSYKGKAKNELNKLTDIALEARHRISLALTALHEGEKVDVELEDAINDATDSIDKLRNFVDKESEKV